MNWNSEPSAHIEPQAGVTLDLEEIRRLYWEEELSTQAIAERFKVNRGSVRYIMCRENIPRRSIAKAMMLVSTRIRVKTTGERNKTHKFCPRCSEVKPVEEFYGNVSAFDGLAGYCKKCYRGVRLQIRGKPYYGLHKRPYPFNGRCEICGIEFGEQYDYHHWDDNDLNLGLWVCCACDYLVEGLDEIDKNTRKLDVYRRLKEEVEEAEGLYVYSSPFSPCNGIYKLFLNGKQTHKWCLHCGKMLPVKEFGKRRFSHDGLTVWCGECLRGSRIGCGSSFESGLHKRAKPDSCELCGGETNLSYHHWDGSNKSMGIWVCQTNKCHHLAEAVDKIDNGSLLPDKYYKLRQEIVEFETDKVLL